MKTAIAATLALVLTLAGASGFVAAQQPLDPQSLVGEWKGNWVRQGGAQVRSSQQSGPYTLLIKSVEGDVVHARLAADTVVMGPTDRDVRGSLQGDRITFGKTELVVSGTQMKGTNTSGMFPVEIALKKK